VKKKSFWAGLYLAVLLVFSQTAFAGTMINGAGATFPYPVYSAWAYNYNKVTGVRLNYQAIGSGGGQRQIFNRTVDFGASDAPLTPEKLKQENLYQFPAVMGGVVLVVNIPGIRAGELKLDPEALTKIFLGKITSWDDKKLKALNPTLRLPRRKITVVHRSDGSGTTAIFTSYLSQVSVEWKEKVGAGVAVKWPVGIGGKGNQGVANYVERIRYSIGYVEFAYAEQNKLTYTLLKNSYWNFVTPNFKSFQDAAASGNFDPRKSFYLWLVNSPGKDAWPIAGATFILLAKEKKDSNLQVVKFFNWAFKNGDETARKLIYVPLPESLKDTIRSYWRARGIY
jgi:phosphate transport system substrate-binding protein